MITKNELIDTLIEAYEAYISFLSEQVDVGNWIEHTGEGEDQRVRHTKLGNQQRKHAQRIIGLKWVLSDEYRERKDIMV